MQAREIILGNSLAVKEMKKLIEMVSKSKQLFYTGETGTGKELVAGFTHRVEKGIMFPLIVPFPELESNFWARKGAFTERWGKTGFEQADNGTIFRRNWRHAYSV